MEGPFGPRFVPLQSTRERILQIIQSRRADTVADLARALELAQATVRRHLDILQRDGLVSFTEVRKGVGRPEHAFSLTEAGHEALPKGYDFLLGELVGEFEGLSAEETTGKTGSQLLRRSLDRIARRTAQARISSNPAADIVSLIETLRRQDFAPAVEQSERGLRIVLNNCPFRSVALAEPTICTYDIGLVSEFLGTQVVREECIRQGDGCCSYLAEGFEADIAESHIAESGVSIRAD